MINRDGAFGWWLGLGACGVFAMLLIYAAHEPRTSAKPTVMGTIEIEALLEVSGLAASRNNDGVLWTHNDSAGGAQVFALNTRGQLLGTYELPGANNIDWEDIAIGPGPVAHLEYLFLGDIGDNDASRKDIQIYQFPEPAVYQRQAARPPTIRVKGLRKLTLTYPDGAHNAEALFVDPHSGDLFVATKEPQISRVYVATKAQLDAGSAIALTFLRELDFDSANSATISPSGVEIILRQEDFARMWSRAPGQNIGEALAGKPIPIPVVGRPTEPNGEAISFDAIGAGYFTLSEGAATQPLYYFARPGPSIAAPPQILVAAASRWKYLADGSEPGAAWREAAFSDAQWKSGDAPLGYGDADEQTVIGLGKTRSKFSTTYFRRSFTVTNKSSIGSLMLKLHCDDGVAVYLNGTPAARQNLPENATATTIAIAAQEELEDAWFAFAVDPAALAEGSNVLAVEVHQQPANDADLSFDLQLLGMSRSPNNK